jgi:hypothetical protein
MDLNSLVTQDKAESGEWFPLILNGVKTQFDLFIYGDDSDKVQKFKRDLLKKHSGAISELGKGVMLDDKTREELEEDYLNAVLARIGGIRSWDKKREKQEPVTWDGTEIKDEPALYKKLLEKSPGIKEFVLNTAGDRNNFLSGQRKG